jgi:cytochrome b subunit of formate dehydrogenase
MRSRTAAWVAWLLVTLSVALLVSGVALARMMRSPAPETPAGSAGDADSAVLALATVLSFSVVGAIVASRHPRNTIGWIFCTIGLVVGLGTLAGGYAEFWLASSWGSESLGETAAWLASWAWTVLVVVPTTFLLLLFPDGRLPSPRWRPVAWLAGIGISGFVTGYALNAGPLGNFPQIVNPYGVDSPVVGVVQVAAALAVGVSMVASALSVIVRARRAGRVERQQIKWLAYGGAVVVGTMFVGGLISIWSVAVSIAVTTVALLGLPISTGIAIVRHRLYDIDLLINHTLVYGALTALLAVVYFGGVTATQAIFRTLTGQEEQPQLAVVVSTLVIAALFNPLRHRIQAFIDRRFYRRKYDAAKTLETFSARLRDETDLDALNSELVEVVRETMQPAHVSLWLRPDTTSKGQQTD